MVGVTENGEGRTANGARLWSGTARFFKRGCIFGMVVALVIHVQAYSIENFSEISMWTESWLMIWGAPISFILELLPPLLLTRFGIDNIVIVVLTVAVVLNWGLIVAVITMIRNAILIVRGRA